MESLCSTMMITSSHSEYGCSIGCPHIILVGPAIISISSLGILNGKTDFANWSIKVLLLGSMLMRVKISSNKSESYLGRVGNRWDHLVRIIRSLQTISGGASLCSIIGAIKEMIQELIPHAFHPHLEQFLWTDQMFSPVPFQWQTNPSLPTTNQILQLLLQFIQYPHRQFLSQEMPSLDRNNLSQMILDSTKHMTPAMRSTQLLKDLP